MYILFLVMLISFLFTVLFTVFFFFLLLYYGLFYYVCYWVKKFFRKPEWQEKYKKEGQRIVQGFLGNPEISQELRGAVQRVLDKALRDKFSFLSVLLSDALKREWVDFIMRQIYKQAPALYASVWEKIFTEDMLQNAMRRLRLGWHWRLCLKISLYLGLGANAVMAFVFGLRWAFFC